MFMYNFDKLPVIRVIKKLFFNEIDMMRIQSNQIKLTNQIRKNK